VDNVIFLALTGLNVVLVGIVIAMTRISASHMAEIGFARRLAVKVTELDAEMESLHKLLQRLNARAGMREMRAKRATNGEDVPEESPQETLRRLEVKHGLRRE
jgi:hypothetical protein